MQKPCVQLSFQILLQLLGQFCDDWGVYKPKNVCLGISWLQNAILPKREIQCRLCFGLLASVFGCPTIRWSDDVGSGLLHTLVTCRFVFGAFWALPLDIFAQTYLFSLYGFKWHQIIRIIQHTRVKMDCDYAKLPESISILANSSQGDAAKDSLWLLPFVGLTFA